MVMTLCHLHKIKQSCILMQWHTGTLWGKKIINWIWTMSIKWIAQERNAKIKNLRLLQKLATRLLWYTIPCVVIARVLFLLKAGFGARWESLFNRRLEKIDFCMALWSFMSNESIQIYTMMETESKIPHLCNVY